MMQMSIILLEGIEAKAIDEKNLQIQANGCSLLINFQSYKDMEKIESALYSMNREMKDKEWEMIGKEEFDTDSASMRPRKGD